MATGRFPTLSKRGEPHGTEVGLDDGLAGVIDSPRERDVNPSRVNQWGHGTMLPPRQNEVPNRDDAIGRTVQFFLGTANRTKVRQLAAAAHPFGVEIPTAIALPEVVEDGLTAVENARLKAAAYADVLRAPVLAMDASLALPDLPPDQQPGVMVRRVPGAAGRPTDDEVLAHYAALCGKNGGRLRAHWTFGFAIGLPDGTVLDTAAAVERTMVAPPCPQRRPGNPLDSLQVEPKAGRRLAQMGEGEIQVLWRDTFGAAVQELLRRA